MNTIAERFLLLRGQTKQGDFAKALGINPNTLRNYENGRALPNQEILERICVNFSVSPEWLLLGRGPMHAERKKVGEESDVVSVAPLSVKRLRERLEALEQDYRELNAERRELSEENRQLYRDKAELLREIGELRAAVARFEERGNELGAARAL